MPAGDIEGGLQAGEAVELGGPDERQEQKSIGDRVEGVGIAASAVDDLEHADRRLALALRSNRGVRRAPGGRASVVEVRVVVAIDVEKESGGAADLQQSQR